MRRIYVLAIAILAIGCSSRSGALPIPVKNSPQIFQKHPLNTGWMTTTIPNIFGQTAEPNGIAVDTNHKVWVSAESFDGTKGAIARVAMDQHVTLYPISIVPNAIAFGSDHNLWVSTNDGVIARVTPTGSETDYSVAPSNTSLSNIIPGPDGALWFIECSSPTSGGIGTITTTGSHTFFSTGCEQVLESGPDGNIWFGNGATISNMTPQGVLVGQYAVGESGFAGIASGSDGALYVLGIRPNNAPNELIKVTTDGTVTHIGGDPRLDLFRGITSGPDGNLWISAVLSASSHLVTFDPATQQFGDRRIKSPAFGPNIIVGPDSNLWMLGRSKTGVYTYVYAALTLMPRPVTVQVSHTAVLSVSETNYGGQWTAIAAKPSIASVTFNSNNGSFVVTGVSSGTTRITVYDSMFNSANVKVTVF